MKIYFFGLFLGPDLRKVNIMIIDDESTVTTREVAKEFVELLPPAKLEDFSPQIQEAARKKGWECLMPVQAGVAPYLAAEKDVIVQSRTGSGKTAAFLLPICERLRNAPAGCQALILVPTRELAVQVYKEVQEIAGSTEITATAIYGGTSYKPQFEAFKNGTQIIIGTPGRLLDHLMKGSLNLKGMKFLVFDEADEMLSMGFYKDMVRIGSYVPTEKVAAMFSATMPESVKRLACRFLRNPEFLTFSGDGVHVSEMDHIYYTVDPMQKDRVLMRVIELEDPDSAIIFCNTKSEVEYVAAILKRFGYDADQISGDLGQSARESVMGRLKDKSLRFLVATDIAARGIDISNLEYVIVYDMHKDTDQYIHRAGRTARAGNRGVAISLVSQLEAADLRRFARRAGISLIEKDTPSEEQVRNRMAEKLVSHLEGKLRDSTSAVKERMKRYMGLYQDLKQHELGDELFLFLLDSFHQQLIKLGRGIEPEPVLKAVRTERPAQRSRAPRPAMRRRR